MENESAMKYLRQHQALEFSTENLGNKFLKKSQSFEFLKYR